MGKHSKPLTTAQKRWITVKYYVGMFGFAAMLAYTFANI